LEISKDAQRFDRDKLKIGNIVVGYLLKDSNEIAYVNLIRYLDVLEIDYKKLYCKNLDKTVDGIDILFIDNEYIDNISIFKTVTDLNIKTVLLTRAKFDSCKCPVRDNFSRVVYKPLNYSKLLRSILDSSLADAKKDKHNIRVSEFKNAFIGLDVLVAEDNRINQKLIKRLLKDFGINVTLASNGLEAFNLVKANRFDIIFMDIQMPVMNGVEATEKILEFEKSKNRKHTPIVALTANVISGDKEKYLSAGMDRYLKKPIEVKELVEVLRDYFIVGNIKSDKDSINKGS